MHDPDVGSQSADPIKFGFKRGAYFESGRGTGPLTISGLESASGLVGEHFEIEVFH
jgi:hypothetical protein